MRLLACSVSLLALTAFAVAAEDEAKKGDAKKDDAVVINIDGKGAKAKYVKEGDDSQKDVTVVVGQTVKWVNKSNGTHTATSDLKVKDKFLFDTEELDPESKDKQSKSIKFTEQMYQDAGGKDGAAVTIGYHCEIHPAMKAKIVLKPAEKGKADK